MERCSVCGRSTPSQTCATCRAWLDELVVIVGPNHAMYSAEAIARAVLGRYALLPRGEFDDTARLIGSARVAA